MNTEEYELELVEEDDVYLARVEFDVVLEEQEVEVYLDFIE